MRRLHLLLACLVLTMTVMAGGIDQAAALLKAQKFMPGKVFTVGKTPARVHSKTSQSYYAYYVFNAKDDGGFVVVSGDDRTEDILCYSEHGHLDVYQAPENMKWWLNELARQIEALGTSLEAAAHRAPAAAVAPLIKSEWNQYGPYNYMCPDGNYVDYNEPGYNSDNRCVTGCVATAMAQVMYYWKWPTTCPSLDAYEVAEGKTLQGLPATTFKWNDMKDTYRYNETGTSANAVAELMRYCGQAVHMGYTPSASGASVSANIMASVFQYSPNSHSLYREGYSVSRWESIIYNELSNKRPVLYSGSTAQDGHQFIVDGYDGAGLFHFNWGWGGAADCYGVLSLADPDGRGNGYQYSQTAIIGIKPAEEGEVIQPMMFGEIEHLVPVAEYSRSSSAANFSDVALKGRVIADYTLESSSSVDVEVGWGLFHEDELVQLLDHKTMNFSADSPWSTGYDASVSFGADLVDGRYELAHVYRFGGDTEWEQCYHWSGNKLVGEVNGNQLTVFVPNASDMSFKVDNITTPDEPSTGEAVSVKASITNTGETNQLVVGWWIQEPGDQQWTNISVSNCYVDRDNSDTVVTSFVPEVAGEYQLMITMGSSMEALATATLKVAAAELIVVDGITYRCIPDYQRAAVINDGKDIHFKSGSMTILQQITASGVDCQVTSISDRALSNWREITSVIIPEGVTSIGDYAFAYIGSLTRLELPSTLTEIGERVIYGCSNLTAVVSQSANPPAVSDNTFATERWNSETKKYDNVPCSATLYVPIGAKTQYEALSGWTWFAAIEEGDVLETVVDGLRYSYCTGNGKATVVQDEGYQELTEVSIPATVTIDGTSYRVTAIGKRAFCDCRSIKSLTIPEGVTSIGDYAFAYMTSANSLAIPEGVTSIGAYAFEYMVRLTRLELPSTLMKIGERVIEGCSDLTAVVSHSANPPAVSNNTFATERWNSETKKYDNVPCPATLYVPIGAKTQYEALSGWTWFAAIEEGEVLETVVDGLRYSYCTGNGKATVVQDEGYQELTEVSIPATVTIDGTSYRVTAIGKRAFYDCRSIKSLTIPEGVTSIGDYAFVYMTSANSLAIPEGVTSIGDYAFAYIGSLTRLELPSTLTEIGERVIEGCSKLTAVVSHSVNPPAVSDNTFTTNKWNSETKKYDQYPCPATLYVPIGAKAQYEALSGWTWFAAIEEGDVLETVVDGLRYSYCTGNGKATVVQDEGYQELTEVSIPATVTIDGTSYRVTTIGKRAFQNCRSIKSLTIPEGVTSIGDYAFAYMTSANSLAIPEGVSSIGAYAFEYMVSLTRLELPSTLMKIGEGVIYGCTDLTAVVSQSANPPAVSDNTFATERWNSETQKYEMIPCPATLYVPIGAKAQYEALSGWTWFAAIEEGDVLETVVDGLRYSYCTGNGKATVVQDEGYQELTEVSIPATVTIDGTNYRVTTIGKRAFQNCRSIKSLTIPEGVTSIGDYAFAYMTSANSLAIPEGVTCIGEYAFTSMYYLTRLELPSTLTEIGERVIEGCSKLTTVVSHSANPPAVSDNTFTTNKWNSETKKYDQYPCPATLYVPIGAKVQYEALSGWTWFAAISESDQAGSGIATIEYHIATDGRWYNLQGVPVDKPQNGMFIKKGRKVLLK